tara:strand:- start:58 stop:555 length:498 start_codon:yes stop_codon:yes gene_type:complete
MVHEVSVIDNFLTDDECDFLINYFKKSSDHSSYESTSTIELKNTSIFDFKKSYIRFKYTYRIKKKFKLKKCYDQLVFWPVSSFKLSHIDTDYILSKNKKSVSVDWTSVCYLNDDYEGGETIIEKNKIKPKKGRLVVFPSKKLYHGVLPVKKSPRFTFISWWRNHD